MAVRPGSTRPVPPTLPDVFFARDHPTAVVASQVRVGRWERVSRGAYVSADDITGRWDRTLAHIVAVHRRTAVPHWFSHESAALLWGLPVWQDAPATHLRQSTRPGPGQRSSVRRHVDPVPSIHRAVVNDLPVTSLALTAVDCARSLPVLDALVVADAALRAGADVEDMALLLDQAQGRAGVATARRVLAAADPGAESAPETATRYLLLAAGLPTPQTQVPVQTWQRTYWVDLGYPQWRVAVEYDGRTKYGGDAWFKEKRRLDAIVEAGWRVVRVTAEDLADPSRLVARVRHVLAAAQHPDRGSVRPFRAGATL